MSKHAVLSPSSAARWLACPGSVVLAPDTGKASRASAEGSVAHEIAALILAEGMTDGQSWLGAMLEYDGFTFEVDQGMLDAIMLYVDEARQAIGDNELLVEVKVPIGHLTGEEGATGTSDLVILRPDEIEVRDLKFGRGVEVEAQDNPQLIMYALGTLELLKEVIDLSKIERVRCTIHQPRLAGPKEAVYTMAELQEWVNVFKFGARSVAQAREFDDGPADAFAGLFLHPTNDGCKFCPAKATCPALRAETLRSVEADFDNLTATGEDTLAADLERVERVEAWCKAVRAEVERRLLQGIPVPGYKLVQGRRGPKKWIDEADAAKVLEGIIGADAWERSLVSPTKALKMVKKGEAADTIGNLTTSNEGKPSVAPESDNRPAITVAVSADEFEDVSDAQE